jgi:hypothetical protein
MTFHLGVLYAVNHGRNGADSWTVGDPNSGLRQLLTIDTTTGAATVIGNLPNGVDAIVSTTPVP